MNGFWDEAAIFLAKVQALDFCVAYSQVMNHIIYEVDWSTAVNKLSELARGKPVLVAKYDKVLDPLVSIPKAWQLIVVRKSPLKATRQVLTKKPPNNSSVEEYLLVIEVNPLLRYLSVLSLVLSFTERVGLHHQGALICHKVQEVVEGNLGLEH